MVNVAIDLAWISAIIFYALSIVVMLPIIEAKYPEKIASLTTPPGQMPSTDFGCLVMVLGLPLGIPLTLMVIILLPPHLQLLAAIIICAAFMIVSSIYEKYKYRSKSRYIDIAARIGGRSRKS